MADCIKLLNFTSLSEETNDSIRALSAKSFTTWKDEKICETYQIMLKLAPASEDFTLVLRACSRLLLSLMDVIEKQKTLTTEHRVYHTVLSAYWDCVKSSGRSAQELLRTTRQNIYWLHL